MEACSNGNIPIAKILICFKASVVQADDDGWTCVDYLRHYCKTNKLKIDSKRFNELENFLKFLENKQKLGLLEKIFFILFLIIVGLTLQTSPPPRHNQKSKNTLQNTRKRKRFLNNDDIDDSNDNSLFIISPSTSKSKCTEDEHNLKEYQQIIQLFSKSSAASKNKSYFYLF